MLSLTGKKPSHQYKPQQNCTVLDEVLLAEICTPDVQITCKDETIMSNSIEEKEVCFDVAKTECKETTESVDIELCTYVYEEMEVAQPAKTIEVEFEKKCQTQMVTVCEPGYHRQPHKYHGGFGHGGYERGGGGYGHHCKEIKQDSCYNTPSVKAAETELTLVLPMPKRECQRKTVELPNIDCQVTTEEKCINVPVAKPKPVTVQKCTPEIGPPKCREVELILPKQVCKDLVVGYADTVYRTPKPKSYRPKSYRFPSEIEYPRGFHN